MDLKKALKIFGLNEKEQEIYLLLAKHGWITALELSRRSPIKRTTLYRILESLTKKGLVEVQIGDKTTHYNAADPQQFESLIIEQEKKTKKLKQSLDDIQSQLKAISAIKPQETSIRFYKGKRGLKQMEWKMCQKENTQILLYESTQWWEALDKEFAEEIRVEQMKKNITIREIFNIENIKIIGKIPADGTTPWTDNKEFVLNHYRHRAIPKKSLDLTQDLLIFNDVIHLHSYRENDLFGIEIISSDYAAMLKQQFEMAWNQAKTIDKFGGKDFK